jgi:2-amino-4-hydroxy-6-hydroxymethyldihydropteridine diphosphokinase
MSTVHLALGSNLGDRAAHLRAAVEALAPAVTVTALSPVYETAPMYVTDQPPFYNMALAGTTALAPLVLLRFVKELEARLGRENGCRFGPRNIDIDILFHDALVVAAPDLEVPHPRLAERAFVLCPLADIAAGLRHPVLGRTVGELCAAVAGRDTVRRVGPLAAPERPAVA